MRIQGGIFLCIQESKAEKADPFLLCACLSHLGLTLQMCAESEGAKNRLRRREWQKQKNTPNDKALHKINFPDMKERCDASIETEGVVRRLKSKA